MVRQLKSHELHRIRRHICHSPEFYNSYGKKQVENVFFYTSRKAMSLPIANEKRILQVKSNYSTFSWKKNSKVCIQNQFLMFVLFLFCSRFDSKLHEK